MYYIVNMEKKLRIMNFRCTEEEANRIEMLAGIYAFGQVSSWLRWAGLNAERTFLKNVEKKTGPAPKGKRQSRLAKSTND